MSGVPVETVVELLMANSHYDSLCYGQPYWVYVDAARTKEIDTKNFEDLRTKVRAYVESLVPKPKLLSECEEWKLAEVEWSTKAYRNGDDAYSDDDQWIGKASDFQVIQPVEVNRE